MLNLRCFEYREHYGIGDPTRSVPQGNDSPEVRREIQNHEGVIVILFRQRQERYVRRSQLCRPRCMGLGRNGGNPEKFVRNASLEGTATRGTSLQLTTVSCSEFQTPPEKKMTASCAYMKPPSPKMTLLPELPWTGENP